MDVGVSHFALRNRRLFLVLCAAGTIFPILFFPAYYSLTGSRGATLPQIMNFLIVLSSMHVGLTLFFYVDAEYRKLVASHRGYYVYLPLFALAACGVTTAIYGERGLLYLYLFYHAWLLVHYGRQNYGLLVFVGIAEGSAPPSRIEKIALHLAPVGSLLAANSLLAGAFMPGFKDAAFGPWLEPAYRMGFVIYMVALACGLVALAQQWRHLLCWRALYLALVLLFWAPTFLFEGYYKAIMGFAVGHALQYYVFMFFVASGIPEHEPRSTERLRNNMLLLGLVGMLGWVLLWILREREIWGPALRFVLGAELGLVMWHFIADAGFWRLRHAWQRQQIKERFRFLSG